MIDATQLRIGNYLMAAEEEYKGKAFAIDAGDIKHIREGMKIYKYEPIPITPEILEAVGFEKVNHIHGYSFFTSKVKKYKGLPIIDVYEGRTEVMGYPVKHCASLHELMNLFFSLTGEELTSSPNNTVK